MTFTRFEIRHEIKRCFYEGGDTFTYKPFDTLESAREWAKANPQEAAGGTLYKVYLHPNYDETEPIYKYDENGKEWTNEKAEARDIILYLKDRYGTNEENIKDIFKYAKKYGLIRWCKSNGIL